MMSQVQQPTRGPDDQTGPPKPAATSVSLANVAGRLTAPLGGVSAPIYIVGAVVTHGMARWVLLGMTMVLLLSMLIPVRDLQPSEAPGTVVLCIATVVMWASLAPNEPVLLAAVLAVSMVYTGLMVPRPYAEIGIVGATSAYVGSEFVFGSGGQVWQAVGVATADAGMGALIMAIRITTERKVNEHTRALAAVNEKLEELSQTDPLTGLANRRRLEDALTETWQHARTAGSPISAIMVDIDYFKQYNDRFGHLGGDVCLQKLATVLMTSVRETDVVARYGGEEFSVVMPDTDFATAWQVAERLREAVASLAEEHPAAPNGHLTISVGVASATPSGENSRQDLLQRAEEGLYLAKRNGRNQVAAGPASEPTVALQHR